MDNIIKKILGFRVVASVEQKDIHINKHTSVSKTKPLIKNFIFLMVVQIANYVFPLISLPYLVRVLGPEKYGLIAFAQSFIGYFILITNYGFELSATREISINRDNKDKLAEIFSSVMYAKTLLLAFCFFVFLLFLQIDKFKKDFLVYILTFGIIIGQTLFPVWLFLGLERMEYITILTVLERGVFTVCIFIFIKNINDYFYVPLFNTIGYMVSGILGMLLAFLRFGITFRTPKLQNIFSQIKQGWYSFISTTNISLYSTTNIFILGLFWNNVIVGYYAAAEKLIYAVQRLLVPLSQTVFPYISKTAHVKREEAVLFLKQILHINIAIGIILAITILLGSRIIVKIILGPMYQESIIIMQIFAFLPLAGAVANVLGFQTMLPFKMDRELAKALLITALINIGLAFILIPFFAHLGAAVAFLSTMYSTCLILLLFLRKANINLLCSSK
ncbi:MAG: flippase [candidate division WOR-3 bacterium]